MQITHSWSVKMNSFEEKVKQMQAERETQQQQWVESMEKHPRCALLPSPEMLTEGFTLGKDATDTQKDFSHVHEWMKKLNALNREFYDHYQGNSLDKDQFGALIQLAFSNGFAAMRHTFSPELEEYVIWYYAGHGHPKPKSGSTTKSSMPKLERVRYDTTYNDVANKFAKHLQDKPVKGGELCLHHVGYCGLYGLIRPWIAGVKAESQNNPKKKKNKHLIIILDSCYSGMVAQDLEELNKEKGPWNQDGCTITIQTACGPDEPTFGGYFSPCFLTLNQNQRLLDDLKERWEKMGDAEKNCYRSLPLPSPKVVTTREDAEQNNPAMEFRFNNSHQLTVLSDPGFFKFCSMSIFDRDEEEQLKKRVLDNTTAKDFMKHTRNFTVLDYKLKTMQNGPFQGHPIGLFLIEDPKNPQLAVCAHVHFARNDTSRVGKINLVHHRVPPLQNLLYVEDHAGLSKTQVKKNRHKIEYAAVPKVHNAANDPADWEYWQWDTANPSSSISFSSHIAHSTALNEVNHGARLVKECYAFVESNEPSRWADHSRWDMTLSDLSYSGKFRRKERSRWMDQYMKKYEENTK